LSFGYKKGKLLYENLVYRLKAATFMGAWKNGAGKSTFLKTLIGLLFPGVEVYPLMALNRKKTAFFFGDHLFYPGRCERTLPDD